ncbi:MAG: histidine kinase N-terminal 7TM domain-containing protein [Anaerolineae bacterium]|jgi:PAS domain S-box-containing protein
MSLQAVTYLLPYFLSIAISAAVGIYALRRRAVPGAIPFAWTALLQALTTVGFVFELISPGLQAKIFWDNWQFVTMAISPLVLLAFVFEYTGRRPVHPWRTFGLLALPGAIFLLFLTTDDWHGLIRPEAWLVPGQPFAALVYDFSVLVQMFALYGFGLVLAGIVLLARFFVRSPRLYRMQIGLIILGALIPLTGTVLTMAGVSFGFHRDTAPFTTAARNLLIAWALFRYHLLDVVPVAWNKVIENMTEAVIVLDARFRIVDLNPAAQKLTDLTLSASVGKPATGALTGWPDLAGQCREGTTQPGEITLDGPRGPRHFDLSCVPLHDRRGPLTGYVVMLREITERRQAQEALRQAYDELEQRVEARTREVAQGVEELRILNELNRRVSASLLPEEVIDTALRGITESLAPDLAMIYLRHDHKLRLAGLYPPEGEFQIDLPEVKCVGECLCGLAAGENQPIYSDDIHSDPRCTLEECKQAGMHAFAALPLVGGEEILGVLGLASATRRDFGQRAAFLETLASEVALGLQNALLHTHLEQYTEGLEETVAQRTRELQAERDRTQAIFETVGESVIVTDNAGRILYMNPATVALTGFPREGIVGKRAWPWILDRQSEELWDEIRQSLRAGRIWRGEMPGRRQDGTIYDAAVTIAPLLAPDVPDERVGSVWVQRDITPLKEAERLKDQFISNVSHELRTPLSVITLTGDNLETFYERLGADQRRSMVGDIREQARVLNDLIGDVLEISRIDSGRISTERSVVDLAQLLRDQVAKQRPLAEKKSQIVAVAAPESLPVRANAGQTGQIVRNLLDNAIKYTPEGGQIGCECLVEDGAEPGPGRWAVLHVSDTGIGIEPEHLPHIFERFYRVKAQGSIPGTGLGLAIARELVELHGGRLTVSSDPGQGTRFSVYLPLGEENP